MFLGVFTKNHKKSALTKFMAYRQIDVVISHAYEANHEKSLCLALLNTISYIIKFYVKKNYQNVSIMKMFMLFIRILYYFI